MERKPKPESTLESLLKEYYSIVKPLNYLCGLIEDFLGSKENEEFVFLHEKAFPETIVDFNDETKMKEAILNKRTTFGEMKKLALKLGIPSEKITSEGLEGFREMVNAEFKLSSRKKGPIKPQ